jgi:hypothetical protein
MATGRWRLENNSGPVRAGGFAPARDHISEGPAPNDLALDT